MLLGAPERRDVAFVCELVLNERVKEFVVEGFVPGLWRANIFPKSVPRSRMTGSKRIMVARSGATAMCLDAAENPMMYVPWWVNIGWFHAMRSSSSG